LEQARQTAAPNLTLNSFTTGLEPPPSRRRLHETGAHRPVPYSLGLRLAVRDLFSERGAAGHLSHRLLRSGGDMEKVLPGEAQGLWPLAKMINGRGPVKGAKTVDVAEVMEERIVGSAGQDFGIVPDDLTYVLLIERRASLSKDENREKRL
jgi:hypothetical protein